MCLGYALLSFLARHVAAFSTNLVDFSMLAGLHDVVIQMSNPDVVLAHPAGTVGYQGTNSPIKTRRW